MSAELFIDLEMPEILEATGPGASGGAVPLFPSVEGNYLTPGASSPSGTSSASEASRNPGIPAGEQLLDNGVAMSDAASDRDSSVVQDGQSPDPVGRDARPRQQRRRSGTRFLRRRRDRRAKMRTPSRVLLSRMARANFYRCPRTGVHIFPNGTKLTLNKVGYHSRYLVQELMRLPRTEFHDRHRMRTDEQIGQRCGIGILGADNYMRYE